MGCDIHLHIEIKLNGRWEHYQAPAVDRDYELFEKMAGVRGELRNAISPPKGLPPDLTVMTQFAEYYDDGHTHSWLNAQEIGQLEEWWEQRKHSKNRFGSFEKEVCGGYLLGNSYSIVKYPTDQPPEITDVRFIFWFNS